MEDAFKRCWATRGSRVFLELTQFLGPVQSLSNPHPGQDSWGGVEGTQK